MRPTRRLALAATGIAVLAVVPTACVGAPSSDMSLGETIVEISDAITAVQQDNALLQAQIDSLREAVARQDTTIQRLANLAGVPLPAR